MQMWGGILVFNMILQISGIKASGGVSEAAGVMELGREWAIWTREISSSPPNTVVYEC